MVETIPAGHRLARLLALLIAGVLVIMLVVWVLSDPATNLMTDWTAFDNAADRVVSGERVYRPFNAETEPLPYLYPPFALWLALPLAATGFYGSFAISAIGTFVAFVVGLRLYIASERGGFDATTGMILAVASGAAVSSTLIGQYSGVYVLSLGLAAWLWAKDRQFLAGLALALLWLKPNIAIAVPVVLVFSRSWRSSAGFLGGSIAVFLSSLPFGIGAWSAFFGNAQMMAELQRDNIVPFEKMVSILGGAQSVFGFESQSPAAIGLFLAVAAISGVSVLTLWTPSALSVSHMRAFGGLAVFVVVANPRLYFYDATLVAFGMLGLWGSAHIYGGAIAKRWLPALSVLTWFFLWGGVFVALNKMVGVLAAAGLIATAVDTWKVKSATTQSGVSHLSGLKERDSAVETLGVVDDLAA